MFESDNQKNKLSEEALVALLQNGSDDGFAILYDRYSAVLFGVIKRIVRENEDAENLLQDCFVKIWRYIENYDATKGRLLTWLLNIARNTAIDFTRSKIYSQRLKNQNLDYFVDIPIADHSSSTPIETIGLRLLVDQLTPQCREIIEWMYFDGYTQQEISENFDLPLGTVKSRARSALIELRKHFDLK